MKAIAGYGFLVCLAQVQSLKWSHNPRPVSDKCSSYDVEAAKNIASLGEYTGDNSRSGGQWTPCTHLKTYGLNFAPFFASFLAYELKPKTALEFGCGLGTMSDFVARQANADVTCLEPEKSLAELVAAAHGNNAGTLRPLAANIFDENATDCVNHLKEKKFDLVTSFEVAEHIPVKYHDALVDFLANSTGKWLVFSAAHPGQLGTGHIPESMFDRNHWVQRFSKAGLVYMDKLSVVAQSSAWWNRFADLSFNAMVFKHPSNPAVDGDFRDDHLVHNKFSGLVHPASYGPVSFESAREFASGVETSMWPELALIRAKILDGTIKC